MAHGYCQMHHRRAQKAGEIPATRCSVEGCDLVSRALRLCAMHHARFTKTGDVGPVGPIFDGSGFLNRDGYRVVNRPGHPNARKANGQILEHQWVMAEHLGRPIRNGETVHHRNGIRDDNRIENLELMTSAHPKGQRPADLVAFAREVLARYAAEVDAARSSSVRVDGLRELRRDLKQIDKTLPAGTQRGLKKAAEPSVRRPPGSRRAGPASSPRRSRSAPSGSKVRIYSRRPGASLIHWGGRHPVFGNRNVLGDPARNPFIQKAAAKYARCFERDVAHTVESLMRNAGFK